MTQPSATFSSILSDHLGERSTLTWEEFTRLALYHPQAGYYSKPEQRVGRGGATDFYTSYSLGPLFARLLTASFRSLLGQEDLSGYTLVEIGAEPEQSLFSSVADHYADIRTIRHGDPFSATGPSILFSNELLDAQPFQRFIYHQGQGWQLCGIRITADGSLEDCILTDIPASVHAFMRELPTDIPHGYRFDIALQAEQLFASYLDHPWHGLLVFFDYGASWHELTTSTPQGSARAYSKHRQSDQLLDHPGEQDLTCHVCWDRLQAIAEQRDLSASVTRQEAFFMRHAAAEIAQVIGSNPGEFVTERRALQELLHPAYFGQRFQALHLLKAIG